jgi:post-GPI attachment to proteins factor 2
MLAEIHKNCFCTFIVVSEIYMGLSYYFNKNERREPSFTTDECRSLNLKRNLFVINLTSILLATYFFIRHNDRCEGGSESSTRSSTTFFLIDFLVLLLLSSLVYTFFALFEYIVVLTNMGYHMTSAIDFHNQHLVFDWRHGLQIRFQ